MAEELKRFWNMKAEAGATGKQRVTLMLYGDISMYPNWYQEDKSAQEIAEELKSYGEIEHIDVRINSPGGSVWGGLAIANILKSWPAPVTTHVDGLAGSAASLIFAAGDERVMPSNTLLFVHNVMQPIMYETFYAKDLRKLADDLDAISEAAVATYKEASTLSEEDIRGLMDKESFISAKQAMEYGMATSIDRTPIAASLHGQQLKVNGLEFDPKQCGITLTEEMRAAMEVVAEDDTTVDAGAEQDTDTAAATSSPDDGAEGEDTTQADDDTSNLLPFAVIDGREIMVNDQRFEVTATWLAQTFDSVVTEIRNEATVAATTAERERLMALDALATADTAEIIARAKADGTSVEAVNGEIVQAMLASGKGLAFLAVRKADANASHANEVAASTAAHGDTDEAARARIIEAAANNTKRMEAKR